MIEVLKIKCWLKQKQRSISKVWLAKPGSSDFPEDVLKALEGVKLVDFKTGKTVAVFKEMKNALYELKK